MFGYVQFFFDSNDTDMKNTIHIIMLMILIVTSDNNIAQEKMKFNKLTPDEEQVIVHKGTEMPFTGKYTDFKEKGTYICKRCNTPLYRSVDKFNSHCGWPSFDDGIPGAVKHIPDKDGERTEIVCVKCGAHLGHVFIGEGMTPKNIRHCVNSISLNFIPINQKNKTRK